MTYHDELADMHLHIAETFFNELTKTESEDEQEYPFSIEHLGAKDICLYSFDHIVEDTKYNTYVFKDGSKLILGDNGYIGVEIP